jgi:hypothetical protein
MNIIKEQDDPEIFCQVSEYICNLYLKFPQGYQDSFLRMQELYDAVLVNIEKYQST